MVISLNRGIFLGHKTSLEKSIRGERECCH